MARKQKGKQKEHVHLSKKIESSSFNLKKKSKKKKKYTQMKGDKLKEEIGNIDEHFTTLHTEMVHLPEENKSSREEESHKTVFKDHKAVTDKDVEDALNQLINM